MDKIESATCVGNTGTDTENLMQLRVTPNVGTVPVPDALLSALMDDIETTKHVGNTSTGIGNLVRLRETRNVGTVSSQNVKLNIRHYTPHDANKHDATATGKRLFVQERLLDEQRKRQFSQDQSEEISFDLDSFEHWLTIFPLFSSGCLVSCVMVHVQLTPNIEKLGNGLRSNDKTLVIRSIVR